MTKEDILTCVLEILKSRKIANEKSRHECLQEYAERFMCDDYSLGYTQGRISLCEDLIKFITSKLSEDKSNVKVEK